MFSHIPLFSTFSATPLYPYLSVFKTIVTNCAYGERRVHGTTTPGRAIYQHVCEYFSRWAIGRFYCGRFTDGNFSLLFYLSHFIFLCFFTFSVIHRPGRRCIAGTAHTKHGRNTEETGQMGCLAGWLVRVVLGVLFFPRSSNSKSILY